MSDTDTRVTAFGIAATFIGTIIGAGFASGNEVLQYFVAIGPMGAMSIIVATALFFLFGLVSLQLGNVLKTDEYGVAINPTTNPFPRIYCDVMITVTLFGTFIIMVAGAGGLVNKLFGVPSIVGSIGVGVLVVLNLLWGIDGLVKAQEFMVPILIVGAILVGIWFVINPLPGGSTGNDEVISSGLLQHWFINGILYVAFNFQLAIAVLVPLGNHARTPKSIMTGILVGAIGLGAGALVVYGAMSLNAAVVGQEAYPMVELAGNIHPAMRYVYSVLLFFGLYSTAISCFFGTVSRLRAIPQINNQNHVVVMIIVSVIGVLLSQFGFSDLVGQVYPVLGYGGLLVMVFMLWVAWTNLWGPNKKQVSTVS
ncbi:hypothetical protein [Stomatohabitans albus]|uniref:YkvI family membrane protein n=1 Tax=Stomatohabitans albus TaxID=3110766 RepID=UPI00300D47D9